MRDNKFPKRRVIFNDDQTSDEEIQFVYNSGEAAIINRELMVFMDI